MSIAACLLTRKSAAVGIVAVCALTNQWLIAEPVRHVLVQLPLLAVSGWLLVGRNAGTNWRWAQGGFAPLIAVFFGIAFWMLPRSIDAAVSDLPHITAKFVMLPAIGAISAIGWHRAHPLLRGFVKAQTIAMSGFMAFLFTHAPARLCNNYLIDAQWRLGEGFLVLAFALAITWSLPLFFPSMRIIPKSADWPANLNNTRRLA